MPVRRPGQHLAGLVRDTVAFPNAMVDRIAPATSDRERKITRDDFGIEDAWPVFCEDFIQWVVEDSFPAGRPAFEEAGAEFVPDVTPWEMMKIQILNGGHAIIAYPSGLMDIHFVHEGIGNPLVRAFLQKVEREEIIPIVPPVPNTDLDGYFRKVEERCLNPKIGDTIRRLCLDGSNRQPKFIIPSIADRLDRGLPVDGLALELASLVRATAGAASTTAPSSSPTTRTGIGCRPGRVARPTPSRGSPWATYMAPSRMLRPFAKPSPVGCARSGPTGPRRRCAATSGDRTKQAPGLVIFDCDGVLVDSEPIAPRLLIDTLAGAGLHSTRRRSTRASSGRSLASTRAILASDFGLTLSTTMRSPRCAAGSTPRSAPSSGRSPGSPTPSTRCPLRLLRRLLLAAGADRALADGRPASGRASRAAPSRRPWCPTASRPPTSSCTRPDRSATLPPPAWWSRTARPA